MQSSWFFDIHKSLCTQIHCTQIQPKKQKEKKEKNHFEEEDPNK
jgi:hypothetical protein